MTAGAVFDLDHPEVTVKAALLGDGSIHISFGTGGELHPFAVAGHQIEGSLKGRSLTIQRIELD